MLTLWRVHFYRLVAATNRKFPHHIRRQRNFHMFFSPAQDELTQQQLARPETIDRGHFIGQRKKDEKIQVNTEDVLWLMLHSSTDAPQFTSKAPFGDTLTIPFQ